MLKFQQQWHRFKNNNNKSIKFEEASKIRSEDKVQLNLMKAMRYNMALIIVIKKTLSYARFIAS